MNGLSLLFTYLLGGLTVILIEVSAIAEFLAPVRELVDTIVSFGARAG